MYLTLSQASKMYEIPRKHLLNLYHADKEKKRIDRFMVENGVIKVHEDYLCPHRVEIETIYLKALETTSGNEKEIAKAIARKTGKEINTVYMYLRNFKFKNHLFAQKVINILNEFIATHNLFYARGIA